MRKLKYAFILLSTIGFMTGLNTLLNAAPKNIMAYNISFNPEFINSMQYVRTISSHISILASAEAGLLYLGPGLGLRFHPFGQMAPLSGLWLGPGLKAYILNPLIAYSNRSFVAGGGEIGFQLYSDEDKVGITIGFNVGMYYTSDNDSFQTYGFNIGVAF